MWGKCKARFPRPIFKQTEVDKETGAINLKKLEPMINTLTPLVTYLLHCNTDITCLKSGTAVKAVIMYVTDYITKCSLKTHVVFDVIRSTYQKNSELIGGPETQKEKARCLMTKMVNNLSAKMEIGSPMAYLYLLQNPDHYTNLDFAPIFWKSFVNEARKASDPEESDRLHEKVTLLKWRGCIIGLSPIYDYIFRLVELEDMCFYDWVRLCKREKFKKQEIAEDLSDTGDTGSTILENVDDAFSSASESGVEDDISETKNTYEEPKCTRQPGLFDFTNTHPLFQSHGTRMYSEDKARIPNFIGETLPHHDIGDREFYCSTMLAFFKPWEQA